MKVVQFSSVHQRYDIRIFLKECVTLAHNNFDITLVVADGKGDEIKDGVVILDAGVPAFGRISRMLNTTRMIFDKVVSIKADIYHFHDPELIPVGLKLKKKYPDSKVIFDSHENYSDDIKDKPYIPALLRNPVSWIYKFYERRAIKKIDAVISATPSIRNHFLSIGARTIDVNNYPFLTEFASTRGFSEKVYDAVYMGAISRIRGVKEVVDACAQGKTFSLALAGSVSAEFLLELQESPGWKYVTYFGQVDRAKVQEILSNSKVAVVTFLPAPNHVESQPNKMFEYMSASIPVVASYFPLWRDIIEGNNCGVCVDPTSPIEISNAIHQISSDASLIKTMGDNGRSAVAAKYNWDSEKEKLIKFYRDVFKNEVA